MRVAQVALVVAVLAAGAWVRWLPRANSPLVSGAARSGPAWPASSDAIWFGAPWSTRLVTVYHLDGVFLFPVSHRASRTDSLAPAAVQALRIQASNLGDARGEACIVRALDGLDWPRPQTEEATIDWPFVFGR